MKATAMPNEQNVTRKLRAIFSADVKGYSVHMAKDEVSTIRILKDHRKIMSTCIEQRGGRIVDAVGDNLLAEFESAVDAVQCAIDVQKELKDKNQELPEGKKMAFRIGINTADVIEDGGQLFGDGVNVAARIESLADAGGICVSQSTYDQVKNKLELSFDYCGEHKVKNIKEPVRVYNILSPPAVDDESITGETLDLPDKPSIAVLPFKNLSGDPGQEFFSDGFTEDIITALAKINRMFVIARESSFTFKGKSFKIQEVGRELGVRYVLEGSIQKFGDQIRITVQLIDATNGHHLWAERYDRELKDIFAMRDEITMKIATALQVKLTEGASANWGPETQSFEAYMKVMQSVEHFRAFTPDDNILARQNAIEALDVLRLQRWLQLPGRKIVVFDRVAGLRHARVLQPWHRGEEFALYVRRQGRRQAVHVQFRRLETFRLEEDLVTRGIRELHDLVLDRRAVAWAL